MADRPPSPTKQRFLKHAKTPPPRKDGSKPNAEEYRKRKEARKFALVDHNQDKCITKQEFVAAYGEDQETVDEFHAVDVNGDGVVDKAEYEAAYGKDEDLLSSQGRIMISYSHNGKKGPIHQLVEVVVAGSEVQAKGVGLDLTNENVVTNIVKGYAADDSGLFLLGDKLVFCDGHDLKRDQLSLSKVFETAAVHTFRLERFVDA